MSTELPATDETLDKLVREAGRALGRRLDRSTVLLALITNAQTDEPTWVRLLDTLLGIDQPSSRRRRGES